MRLFFQRRLDNLPDPPEQDKAHAWGKAFEEGVETSRHKANLLRLAQHRFRMNWPDRLARLQYLRAAWTRPTFLSLPYCSAGLLLILLSLASLAWLILINKDHLPPPATTDMSAIRSTDIQTYQTDSNQDLPTEKVTKTPSHSLPPISSHRAWTRPPLSQPAEQSDPLPPPSAGLSEEKQPNQLALPKLKKKGKMVLVIDDLGQSPERSAQVTALPGPLTLAFLPDGKDLPNQISRARLAGHEILLHLPLEPENSKKLGDFFLKASDSPARIRFMLDQALHRVQGAIGVNNHMGSRFTADQDAMNHLAAALAKRQLFFLDSVTTPLSTAADAAHAYKIPFLSRHIFIDHDPDKDSILKQLTRITELAQRSQSPIIAIAHPHTQTLALLKDWLISQESPQLVAISANLPSWPSSTQAHKRRNQLSTRFKSSATTR